MGGLARRPFGLILFFITGEGVKAVEELAARVLKFEGRDLGKETVKAGGDS